MRWLAMVAKLAACGSAGFSAGCSAAEQDKGFIVLAGERHVFANSTSARKSATERIVLAYTGGGGFGCMLDTECLLVSLTYERPGTKVCGAGANLEVTIDWQVFGTKAMGDCTFTVSDDGQVTTITDLAGTVFHDDVGMVVGGGEIFATREMF
jgi:hypothetical protein